MQKVLMIGADVHDQNTLTKFALDRGPVATRSFRSDRAGRQAMIRFFQEWSAKVQATKTVLAYEASCSGFGLHDKLQCAGIECHVLAPSKIERSLAQRSRKTDEKDAERILELLRGAVLGGNRLPAVWVPDPQRRDDRELVRARMDAVECRVQGASHRRTAVRASAGPSGFGGGLKAATERRRLRSKRRGTARRTKALVPRTRLDAALHSRGCVKSGGPSRPQFVCAVFVKITFQDKLRVLFRRHNVDFDERYVRDWAQPRWGSRACGGPTPR